MKFGLLMCLLLTGQMAFAQTLKEKRIKEEMIERTESIQEKVKTIRQILKNKNISKEEIIEVCLGIEDLFRIYPDHVKAIGTHMDLFKKRTIESKNEALNQLIFFHRQAMTCRQGIEHEYVDPKKLARELKRIDKSLSKQRKSIKKSETNYNNSFYYQYEF